MEEEDEDTLSSRDLVIKMICNFRTKSSMTGTVLTNIVDEFGSLISMTTDHYRKNLESFLQKKNLFHDPDAQKLLSSLNVNENNFQDLRTLQQQISALKCNFNYVESVEKLLGCRTENVYDSQTRTFKPREVYETFQYIPIVEVLKLIMSNTSAREIIISEKPSGGSILASPIDGTYFKSHPILFFKIFKCVEN